jgi:CheY-like chemotaxis protein
MVLGALGTLLGLEPDLDIVGAAVDGDDALRLVGSLRPDVLVTDIEMPGRTGLDVAAEIRRRGLPTRVIILTTFARSGYLRRALDAGVGGYLLKDAPSATLADAIRTVHSGGERSILSSPPTHGASPTRSPSGSVRCCAWLGTGWATPISRPVCTCPREPCATTCPRPCASWVHPTALPRPGWPVSAAGSEPQCIRRGPTPMTNSLLCWLPWTPLAGRPG